MTPARRRELLASTPLGNWVLDRAGFAFDETKVHRDHGRFATGPGAESDGSEFGPGDYAPGDKYSPTANYGNGANRPSVTVFPEDLPQSLRDRAKAWAASLTWTERRTVEHYTVDFYRVANRALRAADGDPAKVRAGDRYTATTSVKEGIDALMSAAAKSPVHDPPLTCWRLFQAEPDRMPRFIATASAAAQTGDLIQMPVFGSSTLNPQFAADASAGAGGPGGGGYTTDPITGTLTKKVSILLEIRSRSGMLVGPADQFGGLVSENEVVQPPTARYRVLGWKDITFGTAPRRVLRLEEVLPAPDPAPVA